jgi:sensor histidine kinase regulating citrate/malate metabolism
MKNEKVYFILDATPEGDADNDGIDDKAHIMDEYPEASAEMLKALKSNEVVVTDEPVSDQWGSFMSGYVPMINSNGESVGVLGIDIKAENYFTRLKPIKRATTRAMVLGFFISFLVASLVWFTRRFGLVINKKRQVLANELEALMSAKQK